MKPKSHLLRVSIIAITTLLLWSSYSVTEAKLLKVIIQDGPTFRRGDVNGDQILDIVDPVALMEFIFLGAFSPGCLDACDANDDGVIDNTDVIFLLSVIFEGDGPIPSPGSDSCGIDPTDDDLDCAESKCAELGHAAVLEDAQGKKD